MQRRTIRHGRQTPTITADHAPLSSPAGHPILRLQQTAGNRAAATAVHQGLAIGRVDDPAEREAERAADAVMRISPAAAAAPPCRGCGAAGSGVRR